MRAATLTEGQAGTVQFNAYTLHYIPKRMYIFVRPDLFSLTNQQLIECPDFFGRIDYVNIYYDNEYHLNELNSYELYKLSLKNGLKRSFSEWNKYYGSVLCLEFGTDIVLNNSYQAEGVRGNFMLQIDLNFTDLRSAAAPTPPTGALTYRGYAIFVESGVLTIDDMLVSISTGSLTEEMIKNAAPPISGYAIQHSNYTGAGLFSSLLHGIKKAYNVAKPVAREVARVIEDVAPYIPHPSARIVGSVAHMAKQAMGGRGKKGGRRARAQSLSRRL